MQTVCTPSGAGLSQHGGALMQKNAHDDQIMKSVFFPSPFSFL